MLPLPVALYLCVCVTQVDEVLNRTFALRMRLGMFDPLETQPYVNEYGPEDIGSPAHRAAAMEATAQGLVLVCTCVCMCVCAPAAPSVRQMMNCIVYKIPLHLLLTLSQVKNAGPVLPLKAGSNIAVVGPLGLAQSALLGDYYGDAYCPGGNGTKPLPSFCVPTIAAAIAAVNSGSVLCVPVYRQLVFVIY